MHFNSQRNESLVSTIISNQGLLCIYYRQRALCDYRKHTQSHSFTHSLTHTCSHIHTHTLTSFTCKDTHSPTNSLIHILHTYIDSHTQRLKYTHTYLNTLHNAHTHTTFTHTHKHAHFPKNFTITLKKHKNWERFDAADWQQDPWHCGPWRRQASLPSSPLCFECVAWEPRGAFHSGLISPGMFRPPSFRHCFGMKTPRRHHLRFTPQSSLYLALSLYQSISWHYGPHN